MGKVTAVCIERIRDNRRDHYQLAVAFKFSIGGDGPYTGESFWKPGYLEKRRVIAARKKVRLGQPVPVCYRSDDGSVNMIDRRAWKKIIKGEKF